VNKRGGGIDGYCQLEDRRMSFGNLSDNAVMVLLVGWLIEDKEI
jgi:hypothetical protein